MPAAVLTAFLDPIRRTADWWQDFALSIDQESAAQNITNVAVTVTLVKRTQSGESAQAYSVSTADHVTVQGAGGVIAVRVPQAVLADWKDGIYDVTVTLTWPDGARDDALVAPVKVVA